MRLVCPNCKTEYEVADSAIPGAGRDVQCGACNRTWFQTPAGHRPPPTEDTTGDAATTDHQTASSTEFSSTRPRPQMSDEKVAAAQAAITAAAANIEDMAQSDGDLSAPDDGDISDDDGAPGTAAVDLPGQLTQPDVTEISASYGSDAAADNQEPAGDQASDAAVPPKSDPAAALAAISGEIGAAIAEPDAVAGEVDAELDGELDGELDAEPTGEHGSDDDDPDVAASGAARSADDAGDNETRDLTEAEIQSALKQMAAQTGLDVAAVPEPGTDIEITEEHQQPTFDDRETASEGKDQGIARTDDMSAKDMPATTDSDIDQASGVDANLADEIRKLSAELDAASPLSPNRPAATSGSSAVLGAVSATAAALSSDPLETDSLAARLKQRVADAARAQNGASSVVGTAPAAGPQVFGASAEAVRQASLRKDTKESEFPNADELSSSLRPKSSIGRVSTLAIEESEPPRPRSSFATGLGVAVALFVVALMAYFFQPQIVRAMPSAEPALASYSATIDRLRGNVSGLFGRSSASNG